MLTVSRILRDYEAAGSVNSLLALWGFVDDHTFLTKAGHVGVAYRLGALDYECRDHGGAGSDSGLLRVPSNFKQSGNS